MLLLDATNAADYLRERGRIERRERVTVTELSGGVSNIVLLVTLPDRDESFVLKQAREQLRVPDPWFCGVERIWREVETLKLASDVLRVAPGPAGPTRLPGFCVAVPRVLWEDREQFCFAMSAAAGQPWKAELMSGLCDFEAARACGLLLGRLHAGTWEDPVVAREFDERKFFEALRVDPYYRRVAEVRPEWSRTLEKLIASMDRERHCLVHGDFSPKNLMLSRADPPTITLIDCEVGHYGDPAFDLGFFLTHLVLKAVRAGQGGSMRLDLAERFLSYYERPFRLFSWVSREATPAAVVARGMLHLAGCLLARIDGKSRVDYLPEVRQQDAVRRLARELFAARPTDWNSARPIIERAIASIS